MTTILPKKNRALRIQVTDSQREVLERRALKQGVTLAAMVRWCVDKGIQALLEKDGKQGVSVPVRSRAVSGGEWEEPA
jgi:hypothetical protein